MKTRFLSLIIALAILITTGGVYAAWAYAEEELKAVHGHVGKFGLSDATINNSKGTISVDASGVTMSIDPTAADNYTAKLNITGSVIITFTPSDVFKNDAAHTKTTYAMKWGLVTDNTDPTAYEASVTSATVGDLELFTKFDTSTLHDVDLVWKDAQGYYQATVDVSTDLAALITLNTFTLDSYTAYTNFSGFIGRFGNIGIEVSEP